MRVCPNCGEQNSERARFCQACASPLEPTQVGPARVRKTVTVVFADVVGSTAIGERLDPESVRSVMARYFEEMRTVLERHGGTVEKFIGDAVMAVFGIPRVHEDDALRAVRAAWEMRERLARLNEELDGRWGVRIANRTGVNTGEVVAGDTGSASTLATGDTVNTAARLEQAAGPGEVLLGELTYRLVLSAVGAEPVEPLVLTGKSGTVPAYRLLEVDTPPGRRAASRLVGRDRELQAISAAFEEAMENRRCRLLVVMGAPGVGKSRLVAEAAFRMGARARVLQGRCLSYGEGITFWPIAEILRDLAGITSSDGAHEALSKVAAMAERWRLESPAGHRLGSLMGLGSAGAPIEESLWAVRKALEAVARDRPLVLVIEDIHWAERALLDLVAQLVLLIREASVLLLCPTRPDLEENHPGWAEGAGASALSLDPLAAHASMELIEETLGAAAPEPLAQMVVEVAAGNPLYVEEFLSMMIDDGILTRSDGGWVLSRQPASIEVPPTISALISSRLERLPYEERDVAQRASVIGTEFERRPVEILAGGSVDVPLDGLCRKDLIVAQDATGEAFSFRHILIRDEAYQSMPKLVRTELHERFGSWLEETLAERVVEFDEIVGYHLERAYRLREELGPIDENSLAIASRGAERLAAAGRRAFARGDVSGAVNLLSRATSLLPARGSQRIRLIPELAAALLDAGEFDREAELLDEAERFLSGEPHAGIAAWARAERIILELQARGAEALAMEPLLEKAIPLLERHGEWRGLARAWVALGAARQWTGRAAAALSAFRKSAEYGDRAGDRRLELDGLGWMAGTAWGGPMRVEDGIELGEDLLKREPESLRLRAHILIIQAPLHAMRGNPALARRRWAEGARIFEELGMRLWRAAASQSAGEIELLAGDAARAEAELRRGYRELADMGERGFLSTTAAWLSEALVRQGKLDQAEDMAAEAAELGSSDDVQTQLPALAVRAKVLAYRGELTQAEAIARGAVVAAAATDYLNLRGDTLMSLAEVLRTAGRSDEARAEVHEAIDVYSRKGNIVSIERAIAVLKGQSTQSH